MKMFLSTMNEQISVMQYLDFFVRILLACQDERFFRAQLREFSD